MRQLLQKEAANHRKTARKAQFWGRNLPKLRIYFCGWWTWLVLPITLQLASSILQLCHVDLRMMYDQLDSYMRTTLPPSVRPDR